MALTKIEEYVCQHIRRPRTPDIGYVKRKLRSDTSSKMVMQAPGLFELAMLSKNSPEIPRLVQVA